MTIDTQQMSEQEFQTLLRFFKCLADENRLKILGILAIQERSADELSALLKMKVPKVAHHLDKLNELGLLRMKDEGNMILYYFNSETLEQLNRDHSDSKPIDYLAKYINDFDWEHKVLTTFVNNEQLKSIPTTRRKRNIILDWLVNKFEKGVEYSEKEVNEIIARYHPDTATLRREFIMTGLMKREGGGGRYWRS